jgi:oligosaccharide repeat unit polymerase
VKYSLYIFIPIIFGLILSVNLINSWELFLYLFMCFALFNFGYLLFGKKYISNKVIKIKREYFEFILLFLIIYFFLDFYLITNTLYIKFDTISMYRGLLTNEQESHKLPFIFLSYSSYYTLVFYLLFFWNDLGIRKYIYSTLLIYFAILSSGRSTMIISFLIIVIYTINKFSFKSSLFTLFSLGIGSYLLFNIYGEMLGKVGEGFGIINYFTAPSKALNEIFYNSPIILRPEYKLTFLPLRAAIDPINYSPIVPYLYNPIEVNAFTLIGVLLNDLGHIGTLLLFIFLGFFLRLLNNRAFNDKFEAKLSINIISVILLLSCFHDYLTTSISLIFILITFQFINLNTRKFVRN